VLPAWRNESASALAGRWIAQGGAAFDAELSPKLSRNRYG